MYVLQLWRLWSATHTPLLKCEFWYMLSLTALSVARATFTVDIRHSIQLVTVDKKLKGSGYWNIRYLLDGLEGFFLRGLIKLGVSHCKMRM